MGEQRSCVICTLPVWASLAISLSTRCNWPVADLAHKVLNLIMPIFVEDNAWFVRKVQSFVAYAT